VKSGRDRGQGTKAVHGLLESRRGPLNPPIVQSSTVSDGQRRAAGVDPGTVPLSVGVEDAADLVADVLSARDAV
jgi:O-acetylhomoserine/O-acetylserine sulfhydrylase-like pyridoxal-dependent enzyme